MSKAARAIPGQHVMSRLFARVASRPAIGPSPAFFARFGLDDPWAASGTWGGGEDSRNPLFTFLSAEAYYRDLARMRGARERLMARFAAMEAGPLAASSGYAHRLPDPVKPRTSSFATGAMSSPVLLAAAPLPEPEANETAGRWVERRKEKVTRAKKAPEARPLARALRREGPAGDVIATALRDAGVSTRDRGTPALATAMREARGLSAEGQAEIARRVVRSMRGPSRHAARAAMDEMVETQDSRPLSVALSRQPVAGRSRKGLRPVLASSPSLVVLQHEEAPEVAKAAEPRLARRAANAPVVRESAHREAPVAAVAREVRTQRGTGRAGPPSSDVFVPSDVPVEAPRRRPTERLARRTQAAGMLPTSMDDRRGFAAVEPVVASEGTRALRRVAARSVAGLPVPGAEERLALSPVGYVSTRRASPMRAAAEAAPARATRRAVASPSATFLSPAPAPETEAAPAPARRRAAARPAAIAASPVREAVEAISRANLPASRTPASVRAAARSAEPAAVGRRSALVSAAPTSYVAVAAPELEIAPVAKAARRGVQRAVARSVAVAHADDRGAPMLSQAPVAHARSAPARSVQAVRGSAPVVAAVAQALPAVSRQAAPSVVSVPTVPGVARRVFQRVDAGLVAGSAPSMVEAAPVATTATARAALRSAPVVSRDGRGVRRLSADPTSYVHIAHHEPEVAAAEAVAGRRAPARRAVEAAPVAAAVEKAVVEPRSATVRAARRAAAPVVAPEARRGVLAPTPTRYVTAAPVEVTAEGPAEVVRARATSRIAARADAPVALDDRGVGLVSRSATAYTRPEKASRRPLSASPVASLLEPARPAAEVAAEPAGRVPRRAGVVAPTKAARPARAAAAAAESPRAARALPTAAIGPVARAMADQAPEGDVAAPRMAATRRVAARLAAASPEGAVSGESARSPAASPARRVRMARLADALPARSMGAAGHALLRGELNASDVSDAAVMRAAVGIVRDRSAQRRAVRPAMPHALTSTEFRWAIPVAAPVEAAANAFRSRQGAASGPVTREDLSGVLRRVTTAVRALERSDRTRLVTEGPQRLIAEAGLSEVVAARGSQAGRSATRRSIRPTAEGVFAQSAAPSEVEASAAPAPRARRAAAPAALGSLPPAQLREILRASPELRESLRAQPQLRAIVRAEGRAAVAPSAIDGSAAPTVRLVRRAFAGTTGAAATGMEHVASRGMAPATPATGTVARYRTQRTAAGVFAPVSRADVPTVQPAFGLGTAGIPTRRMARVDAATGMVLPEPQSAAAIEAAAPAVGARRAAAGGARAVARGRATPAARAADRAASPRFASEARPFLGTLGELSERADASKRGTSRRPSRISADATTGAYFASAAHADVDVDVDSTERKSRPAYAVRAIEGSLANPPASRDVVGGKPMATRVGTSGGLLVALARAERPEEVVQVILERSAQMRSLASELPQQAGTLVTRLAEMGEREGAARSSAASAVAPDQQFLSVAPKSSSTSSGRSRSRRQSSTTAGSSQSDMGATKVTKLASKLMSLIHLAEAERKKDHQGDLAYRMAADSSEARAEAAGPAGEKTPNENVNMKALQRDVLEAVLRELELTQQRRQEDPDGRSIWW